MDTLYQDLHQNNVAIYGQISLLETKTTEGSARIFDTFRRAITGKVRSPSLESYPKRGGLHVNGSLPSPGLPPVGEYELSLNQGVPPSTPKTPKLVMSDVGGGGGAGAQAQQPILVAGASASTTSTNTPGLKAVNMSICAYTYV